MKYDKKLTQKYDYHLRMSGGLNPSKTIHHQAMMDKIEKDAERKGYFFEWQRNRMGNNKMMRFYKPAKMKKREFEKAVGDDLRNERPPRQMPRQRNPFDINIQF